jgi:hypothetical protein
MRFLLTRAGLAAAGTSKKTENSVGKEDLQHHSVKLQDAPDDVVS